MNNAVWTYSMHLFELSMMRRLTTVKIWRKWTNIWCSARDVS